MSSKKGTDIWVIVFTMIKKEQAYTERLHIEL